MPWLRGAGLGLAVLALTACTPQAALLMSALPDGTASVLLSHLQGIEDDNLKRVADLEARKDWDGLAKLAGENLARDPNNADWWTVAGFANSQAGRHALAIQCYSEVVRLSPDEMLGWSLLAQSYRDVNEPARAIQTLNNAHRVRGGSADTWFLLGESYFDLNRDVAAESAFREALGFNRDFARAWFGLGRVYARLGRTAEFDQALKSLTRLDPALADQLAKLRPATR
jgi:tetratricopeptide (TPR) repeat protein